MTSEGVITSRNILADHIKKINKSGYNVLHYASHNTNSMSQVSHFLKKMVNKAVIFPSDVAMLLSGTALSFSPAPALHLESIEMNDMRTMFKKLRKLSEKPERSINQKISSPDRWVPPTSDSEVA